MLRSGCAKKAALQSQQKSEPVTAKVSLHAVDSNALQVKPGKAAVNDIKLKMSVR